MKPSGGEEDEESELWSANYAPQDFQKDLTSILEPLPEDFRYLLEELEITKEEIDEILKY